MRIKTKRNLLALPLLEMLCTRARWEAAILVNKIRKWPPAAAIRREKVPWHPWHGARDVELNETGNFLSLPRKGLSTFSLNTFYSLILALNMLLVCMWMIGGWK